MKFLTFVALFVMLLSMMVQACDVFDEATALKYVADGKKVVLFLGANWCPHCRREKPLFETACDTYRSAHAEGDVLVGSIDCASSGCPGFHVSGIPDIRYYNAPQVYSSYSGPDYVHWLEELK